MDDAADAAVAMYEAAGELMDAIERLRDVPEIQGSWADMFLRSLMVMPAWSRLRGARKDWRRVVDERV